MRRRRTARGRPCDVVARAAALIGRFVEPVFPDACAGPVQGFRDAVSASYDAGVLTVRVAGAYAGTQAQRMAIESTQRSQHGICGGTTPHRIQCVAPPTWTRRSLKTCTLSSFRVSEKIRCLRLSVVPSCSVMWSCGGLRGGGCRCGWGGGETEHAERDGVGGAVAAHDGSSRITISRALAMGCVTQAHRGQIVGNLAAAVGPFFDRGGPPRERRVGLSL
jgi:hypothetical protein